jgi:hypothetical protein
VFRPPETATLFETSFAPLAFNRIRLIPALIQRLSTDSACDLHKKANERSDDCHG